MENNLPPSTPQNTNMDQTASKNKNLMGMLIAALVVLVVAVFGFYFYKTYSNKLGLSSPNGANQESSQTAKAVESLGQELDSFSINSVEADFQEIDQEIQSL